jgi:hypothetical protein
MSKFSEKVRKTTTFLLASFFWLHAIFLMNIQSSLISKCAHFLRLTSSEIVIIVLLVVFAFTAGSSFWKAITSVAYIYVFPFVLLIYAFYCAFLILRAMHRWFKSQSSQQPVETTIVVQKESDAVLAAPTTSQDHIGAKKAAADVLKLFLRPFQRFTFLWCILLLAATHLAIVWLCLVVVVLHLARQIFRILEVTFFSGPLFKKIGANVLTTIETALAGIAVVTPDTPPTAELRNLWNQLNIWTKATNLLKDSYLVSRWAWVLGIVVFGSIYTYFAVLFSFVYFGIARVSGVPYAWPDALVSSLFIPFFVSDLPKIIALKFVGGLHCLLVVAIGIGTLVNFIQRQVRSIHKTALEISDRLADQKIREKFLVLEAKLAVPPATTPPTADPDK